MKRSQFKGKFVPKNAHKYNGNVKQIVYRSSWERLFMTYCDKHPNIISWSSEEIWFKYELDGNIRTYWPDFWIQMIDTDGNVVEKMVEIKPHYQKSWKINKVKWKSARQLCETLNMEFVVLTEKELF